MVLPIRELTVFIASPSDCEDERAKVREVADQVSSVLGQSGGVRLRVSAWDQVPLDLGRPQERINPLVDECDIFIGVLNRRWGTPTGEATSGFSEEFERVVNKRKGSTTPRVWMFFKSVPAEMLVDPGPELQSVLAFRQRIEAERLGLYQQFGTTDEFGTHLWRLFAEVVHDASDVAVDPAGAEGSRSAGPAGYDDADLDPDRDSETIDTDRGIEKARAQIAATAHALTRLASGAAAGPGDTVFDADRLLLVAVALTRDAGTMPVHVANRLYRRRTTISLAGAERELWLRSVLNDVGSQRDRAWQHLPGWGAILANAGVCEPFYEEIAQLVTDEERSVVLGALEVLRRLRHKVAALWNVDDTTVARWEQLLSRESVRLDVLDHLAGLATRDDLQLLDAIVAATDSDDVRQLAAALRGDPNLVVLAIAGEYTSASWKINAAVAALDSCDDRALTALASRNRTAGEVNLRAAALRHCLERGLTDPTLVAKSLKEPELLELLLDAADDPSLALTVAQVSAAVEQLKSGSDTRREAEHHIRSRAGTVAELATGRWSMEDLRWSRDADLVPHARRIFDTDAEEVLEGFYGAPGWKKGSSVDNFVRSKERAAALTILLNQTDPAADIDRVRAELGRQLLYSADTAAALLLPHAEAGDIPALLDYTLSHPGPDRAGIISRVIELGGAQAVLERGEANDKAAAVRHLGVSGLGRDRVRALLHDEAPAVRLAATDALAATMDTSEIIALLDDYVDEQPTHYYNVVVALDWHVYMGAPPFR